MSTALTSVPTLTAEEFVERYGRHAVELVRGLVVETPMPMPLHGKLCATIARWLGNYCEEHDCGHVMCNDSFTRTQRYPDTVRGPDVSYYSYERLARGKVPQGLLDVQPELVVEIRSPHDRWTHLLTKAGEYLNAGVKVVLIIDPDKTAVTIIQADEFPRTLHNGDTLTIPDLLPGFSLPLPKLFA